MKRAIVTALAVLFLTSWELSDQGAYAQAPQSQQSVKKKATAAQPAPRRVSPYSYDVHRPEYDVYVKGAYIGSDPDPRIRWTLEREAKGGYGLK
jgi:hypothetical protein